MRILFVSKPMTPPFNDGSKSLVRALCGALPEFDLEVLGRRGQPPTVDAARVVPVYPALASDRRSSFAPSLADNARALSYLAVEWRSDLHHFVFAPNPRSSGAIRAMRRVRRKPCLQTIASPPKDFADVESLLFGDVVVAQSEWTAQRVRASMQPGSSLQLEVIRPPLGPLETPSDESVAALRRRLGVGLDQPLIVYPGDLEFSRGARRVAELVQAMPDSLSGLVTVYACRSKTPRAASAEQGLRTELADERVIFAGELPSLLPLLRAASAVVFPVEDLFGKVDIPITLLEACALGTPVLVADEGPAAELDGALRLPCQRPGAWFGALAALSQNQELRQRVVSEQREAVAGRHALEAVAERYAALYRRLLKSGPGTR